MSVVFYSIGSALIAISKMAPVLFAIGKLLIVLALYLH
jgi:hypothetical protein